VPMRGPTTNHEEIRSWAKSHNAMPVEIMPHVFDGEPAILRLTFGRTSREAEELRPITWESFFAQFDLLGLVFLYEPDRPEYELLLLKKEAASGAEVGPN
jgi:hypothetical protein